MTILRDPEREAYHHMQDCRARGMTAAEIIASCMQRPLYQDPTWGDAAHALYVAWQGLKRTS